MKQEKLKISDFINIQQVSLEIKPITIFIGEQASGKSVLSKVIYFCRNLMLGAFSESLREELSYAAYKKSCCERFESIFPAYSWKNKPFKIEYSNGSDTICIEPTKSNSIKITTNIELKEKYTRLYRSYKKYRRNEELNERGMNFFRWSRENELLSPHQKRQIFIPAGRTYFSILQKSVFNFLSQELPIDYFMKGFGSNFEWATQLYGDVHLRERATRSDSGEMQKRITKVFRDILKGEYETRKDGQWIVHPDGREIKLEHGSSGQQASAPMLVILQILPFWGNSYEHFSIEEPEAHLFPFAQKQIAEVFAELYNIGKKFIVTTHSPYFLSAFNNLILSNDLREKIPTKFNKRFPPSKDIKFDDIAAYSVKLGKVKSLKNNELRLIGESVLDEVSDKFEDDLHTLLGFEK